MKKFNLLVLAIWLVLFGIATVPTNGTEQEDWHDTLVIEINHKFVSVTNLSPVALGQDGYDAIALNDSRATLYFLQHTFVPLVLILLALNIAFYAGNGTFGRWGGAAVARGKIILFAVRAPVVRWKMRKNGIIPRSESDKPFSERSEESFG